jgi:hypothetical protein
MPRPYVLAVSDPVSSRASHGGFWPVPRHSRTAKPDYTTARIVLQTVPVQIGPFQARVVVRIVVDIKSVRSLIRRTAERSVIIVQPSRLEDVAGLSVAGAMLCSGVVMKSLLGD